MSKSKIKPIYTELQGYLSQAPSSESVAYIRDQSLWQQLNNTIEELNETTGGNYDKFKIIGVQQGNGGAYILNSEYRSKLNGLIMRIYGEYFEEEVSPFSGGQSTIVSQNQSQTTHIAMIMDFQSQIDKKLYSTDLKEKEKKFLEKVKTSLPSVKSLLEVIQLVLSLAKYTGLSTERLLQLLN